MSRSGPLRMGVLGAARITPMALLRPARRVPEVEIAAVAARDSRRAAAFARKHGIARTHATYDDLIADPEIDAIYNPLPNSHHALWSIRALEAGKHVLCEKPIASNTEEAQEMDAAARRSGRMLVEAFHYRYHPLAARLKEVIESGAIGAVCHLEAHMCIPLLRPGDIRFRYDLAGGATMDVGCYTIHLLRHLAGAEPRVTSATARLSSAGVDRYMEARFTFEDGRTARLTCALLSAALVRVKARVRGERGEIAVLNPYLPHLYHRLRVRTPSGSSVERVPGEATYTHQLRAFAAACRTGVPPITSSADAIANMRVIDAVYTAAGLPLRGT